MSDMKPIIILPPGAMTDDNIKKLEDNGICVVVAEKPEEVRFLDPIPSAASRDKMIQASVQLSRILLSPGGMNGIQSRADACRLYTDILLEGTPLESHPGKTKKK